MRHAGPELALITPFNVHARRAHSERHHPRPVRETFPRCAVILDAVSGGSAPAQLILHEIRQAPPRFTFSSHLRLKQPLEVRARERRINVNQLRHVMLSIAAYLTTSAYLATATTAARRAKTAATTVNAFHIARLPS